MRKPDSGTGGSIRLSLGRFPHRRIWLTLNGLMFGCREQVPFKHEKASLWGVFPDEKAGLDRMN
jgi:hypothetical protein